MDCFTARRAHATVISGVPPHAAARICWSPSAPRRHRFRARRRRASLHARAERWVYRQMLRCGWQATACASWAAAPCHPTHAPVTLCPTQARRGLAARAGHPSHSARMLRRWMINVAAARRKLSLLWT